MTVNVEELMKLLGTLCDNAGMRATVKESLKGGVITGACAVVGGMLFGPPGLAIGGTAGGLTAAYMSSGKFQPVSSVLYNMRENERQMLYDQAMRIVSDLSFEDVAALTALVMGNMTIQQKLITCCVTHLRDHLRMQVID